GLMQICERSIVRGDLDTGIDAAGDNSSALVARHVDAIDVVPAALLHDGIDAFRVAAPRVRANRETPVAGRLYWPSGRPAVRPSDQHQPQAISLKSRPLHGEIREPL